MLECFLNGKYISCCQRFVVTVSRSNGNVATLGHMWIFRYNMRYCSFNSLVGYLWRTNLSPFPFQLSKFFVRSGRDWEL